MRGVNLDTKQLDRLSDITANIGLAFFASTFIPFLIGIENPSTIVILLTLANSFGCWLIAIYLAGGQKYDRNRSK